jgi:hypothetical protein
MWFLSENVYFLQSVRCVYCDGDLNDIENKVYRQSLQTNNLISVELNSCHEQFPRRLLIIKQL